MRNARNNSRKISVGSLTNFAVLVPFLDAQMATGPVACGNRAHFSFEFWAVALVAGTVLASVAAGCTGGAQMHKLPPPAADAAQEAGSSSPDGQTRPDGAIDHPTAGGSKIGSACSAGNQCASGFCADGVCCNEACDGICRSCASPESLGTCIPADVGTDPRQNCEEQGVAACGTDGVCDGTGACEKYAAGVICQSAGCTGSTLTSAQRCDGQGVCMAAQSQSCAPFTCGASGQCKTTCTTDGDCLAPNTCMNGSCGKVPIGATCTSDVECNTGICAQAVCCATACPGACASCALPGSAGVCTPLPAAQAAPTGQCTDLGTASCGTNGLCDGAGNCQVYAPTTVCAAGVCAAGLQTPAAKCNGKGACVTGAAQPCSPYGCGGGTCKTTCASDTDCAAPNVCTAGTCGLLPNGHACTMGASCGSGFCAQNVCCASACTGTCLSCDVAGSLGKCVGVPADRSSLNQCVDQGAPACKLDGLCDGNGGCQQYASGTPCAAASCSGSTFQPASTCTGSGACVTPATSSCLPYLCAGGACKKSCAVNTDCAAPVYGCSGGRCVAAANLTVKTHTLNTSNLQWIYFDIQITNNGPAAVVLSQITVKYWYTYDTPPAAVAQAASCTYANGVTGSCGSTTIGSPSNFAEVSPPRTNADFYFTFGFTSAAGNLAAGATVELGPGFHKNDFSNYIQTNDYSYNPATAFTADTKVTVYLSGVLIYGTEPS